MGGSRCGKGEGKEKGGERGVERGVKEERGTIMCVYVYINDSCQSYKQANISLQSFWGRFSGRE